MKIVLGLVLGVLTGLFLGEIAAPFVVVGEIFIGLLQMTVLPYIVVSLVSNLGRITWSESKGLLIAAMAVLGVLLLLGVVVLLTVPLAFPDWRSASFFSSSLVQVPATIDLVAQYIPANPFASMANNVVPATVLFSILLGIGVSGLRDNDGLLRALDVLADALNRINKIVIKATPLGAFAIAAGVAGTVLLGEISKLQAYLLTYTVVSLILAFLVLPLLTSALTPFRYRDLLTIPRDTLVTIFATAKIIVVLPQLIEDIRELFRRYGYEHEDTDAGIRILLPLAYPFPNLGTYAILMFIPFSAWYLGRSLDFSDQLMFQLSAMLSSFVAPIIGIPFLLDLMRLPADLMELFIMSTVYTDRIRVVLGAMHLISLTVIAVSISHGIFRVKLKKLLRAGVISLAAVLGSLLLLQSYLSYSLGESYQGDRDLIAITWMDRPVPAKTYNKSLPPVEPKVEGRDRLSVIEQRHSLRVGYLADSLPFAFRNDAGDVVGFDMEMGHHLASDLGVDLELVRVKREQINALFDSGQIDIVMSGVAITPARVREWNFGDSPLDLTLGFLVEDHRRNDFRSYEAVTRLANLKLGVVQNDDSFIRQSKQRFPNAEFVNIKSPRSFLRGQAPDLDAVIYSAEGGSAWTLIYPGYTVVVPLPLVSRVPLGYPLPQGEASWSRFVSEWTRLKKKDGTVDALFDHWIGGAGAAPSEPRWSVIRDVLHWIE
jgi:Na+/H+-dicarboxylate symporter/ABC-type amino acid transport substrate-binding protein